jgi:transcriptional regulator with XRE-family HTH domain
MSRTALGRRVRTARNALGLSGRALDDKAGITPGHTSSIELGVRRTVTADTAAALARALGVSLDWLISGEGEGPSATGTAG